jgi:ribosomal protein S18 acetylase RimI-like enzyme
LPGLSIREVLDGDDLDAWMEVFRICFEMPDVAVDFFRNAIGHSGFHSGTPYRHYLGLWKDEPVACSSVYFGGAAAGIYNVATLPSFRGRGIGAEMTRRPMRIAREHGFGTGVLHSSSLGRPVYEKLGFREHCRLAVYLYQPFI